MRKGFLFSWLVYFAFCLFFACLSCFCKETLSVMGKGVLNFKCQLIINLFIEQKNEMSIFEVIFLFQEFGELIPSQWYGLMILLVFWLCQSLCNLVQVTEPSWSQFSHPFHGYNNNIYLEVCFEDQMKYCMKRTLWSVIQSKCRYGTWYSSPQFPNKWIGCTLPSTKTMFEIFVIRKSRDYIF